MNRTIVLVLPVLLAIPATVRAAGEAAPERPGYKLLRFDEDWSGFEPPAGSGAWCDAIKHVDLVDDGSIWVSFGGRTRLRIEDWSGFGFGAPATDDDTFALWRAFLHADLHVGEDLRFYVEGKSALSSDRDLPGGRRTSDVDSLDLEQAFGDLHLDLGTDADVTIRAGRQWLLFGAQRLVSPLAWSNTMRRWDGVQGIVTVGAWRVRPFWTQFAPVRKYDFNQADADSDLFGVYVDGTLGADGPGLDLYWLDFEGDPRAYNGTMGHERRHTLGGRLHDAEGGWDWDVEGAWQSGSVGSGDVNAFMVATQVGRRFGAGGARVFVGFDWASGDDGAGGDVETFNHLYPLGHAYLGQIDAVGRQNILDLSAGVQAPLGPVHCTVAGHRFWRDDDDDALYNAGGGVVRAGAPGTDRSVGWEIDVIAKWAIDRHLALEAGYGHFFAGDFLEETGAHDDTDFLYVQLEYTF